MIRISQEILFYGLKKACMMTQFSGNPIHDFIKVINASHLSLLN